MPKQTEYFLVAREPENPNEQPREMVERFFQRKDEEEGNHFNRAVGRQSWLKFREKPGWGKVRLYEAREMPLVKDDNDQWVFVSPSQEEA